MNRVDDPTSEERREKSGEWRNEGGKQSSLLH